MIGVISAREVVQALTTYGRARHDEARHGAHEASEEAARLQGGPRPITGEKQMKLLRRLPKILKFIPRQGVQDLRAWFLTMQYWLGGSDDNVEQMVRFLVGTYASDRAFKGAKAGGADRLIRRWDFITPISRGTGDHD